MERREKVNACKELAKRSGQWTSFDPERHAEVMLDSMESGLSEFLNQLPEEVRDDYEDRYIEKFKELLSAQSRCFSQAVTGAGDNREQLIGDMARDLKRLAVELNVCIVAISQLSRAKDKPEPTLMEMRGSGQIEEACDTAVLVYRPYVYGIERYKDGRQTYGTAQLTIAKGRNIGLAQEIVAFNGDLTYFHDLNDQPQVQAQSNGWEDKDPLPF